MTDFYIKKANDLSKYECDQTVIIHKKYLKHVARANYEEEHSCVFPDTQEWFPYTNSYYPYTEDVDAFARVNHLLTTRPSFESLTSLSCCECTREDNPYSERLAQLQYLYSSPVSFLILGKPDIGEQELGKLLAEHWQCVYIDPETLIQEEINSGSRAGLCIEFNLRCGRAIGVDVVLRLVQKRVKSKSAQHRGFVICGFPMIPNDLYEEDPVSSESAVFNIHEIFDEVIETVIDIGIPPTISDVSRVSQLGEGQEEQEEEETSAKSDMAASERTVTLIPQKTVPIDVGSATDTICAPGDMEKHYEEQLDFIFSLFQKPFIIIYIVCNNSDVVSKHTDYRFDVFSRGVVDLQKEHEDKMVYTYFTTVHGSTSDEIPEDFIDVVKHNTMNFNPSPVRQLVKLPKDFPSNMVNVLDRYRYFALPVIERHILVHDVEYFIKVDGRIAPIRMFNAIKMRLRVLPLQKVVLPEKLLSTSTEPTGEAGPVDDVDFEGLSFEECFEQLRKRQIASSMFKWGLSDWGPKCPVSMKEGGYRDGDPKLSVHFMNKVFFLADEEAFLKFYRNPRPYLLPPYPKPRCKIFVMGPRYSGKTAVATCLGYFLQGEVLNFDKLVASFFKLKQTEYEDQIRLFALNKAITILNEKRRIKWEQKEQERQINVDKWLKQQIELLEETVKLRKQLSQYEQENLEIILEMSSFPTKVVIAPSTHTLELDDVDSKIKIKSNLDELEKLIRSNGLPEFIETQDYDQLLSEPEKLFEYLPPDLVPPEGYNVEPATIFDDFVKEYAEDAVKNASYEGIELTSEHIAEMLIETIKNVEQRSQEQGYNKGGWIVDGVTPNEDLFNILIPEYLPDDIIMLKDIENNQFLVDRFEFRGQNEFRDYRTFFMKLGKTDAAWRSPSLHSTDSYRNRVAKDFMGDILEQTFITTEERAEKDRYNEERDPYFRRQPRKSLVETYKRGMKKFAEDWEIFSDTLIDHKVTVTDIIITDKSLEVLLKEVVKNTEDRFRQVASEFTSEDRVQEVEDFGEPELQGEELEEGEEKPETDDLFSQNRRFGDTFNYCPVTFHNHWVLWRGKDEFTAKFENKLYLMCNENAMTAFIDDPRHYLLENKPPDSFPPPRICILGPAGSGRTTVAKALCRNLGLYYGNYEEILKYRVAPKSKLKLFTLLKMAILGEKGRKIQNYLIEDEPLEPEFLNSIVSPFWFDEPMKEFGFVLNGFPKRPSDIEFMRDYSTIPDIIIELSIGQGEIHGRLIQKLVDEWQREVTEKQNMYRELTSTLEEKRINRFRELLDLRKEERYAAKRKEKTDEDNPSSKLGLENTTDIEEDTAKSQVSYDSVAEEADIDEVNRIITEELPDPIFEEEAEESLEEAMERITGEVDDSYITELEYLRIMRELCEAELIPWVTVDAGMTEEKVFAQVMRVVDKFKFRNNSIFERVYAISVELADKLLSNGYYFLSKFGKTCPVQVYENVNPVQMFLPLEERYELYPVIHRQYIYFLTNKENLNKFKEDPLKYTLQKNANFPVIPLKLAITGPPKSGKSAVAERFKRDLGLRVISRGQAGRYVLKYLQFSELAKNMESVLRLGWELTNEMVIKCVQALTFEGRSITQGYVLDGFPTCIGEVRYLADLGLMPNLVIDLQAEHANIYEFLAGSQGKRGLPTFSRSFIEHRCEEWSKTSEGFRSWLDKEYQIIGKIQVQPCKWGVWNMSYELATAVFSEVKYYHQFVNCDSPMRLANMLITPLEFLERQGAYKHYCPCCLYYHNYLINGGDPPDRTGVVQYRNFYYYICPDHIKEFINNPEKFLSPYNPRILPKELPVRIFPRCMPENCYEEGACVVCYRDSQPKLVVRKGNEEFVVVYREKVYLFDSIDCLQLFMREPGKYFAKSINFKGVSYPSLDYKQLPTLGLLEQYDARQLIRAIRSTGILRPVIPGLSIEASACINMGLILKLNNPRTPQKFIQLYKEAQNKYNDKINNLITYLKEMKKMINPYLYYDEPLPAFVDTLGHILNPEEQSVPAALEQAEQDSEGLSEESEGIYASEGLSEEREGIYASEGILDELINKIDFGDDNDDSGGYDTHTRRVPVPDERFDYLCNYFKPASKVPAFLNIVDIAGLVKGASEGQGLGNAFLSHISACDAIFHLCRAFEDPDVTHIEGEVDPIRDLEIIGEELRLKDEESLLKHMDKLERTVLRGSDKKSKPEYDTLVKVKSILTDQKQHIRFADWATNDIEVLNKYLFLTSKPAIYLINLAEKDYIKKKNKWLLKLKEWVDKNDPGATIIPFSGMFEHTIAEFEDPILKQKFMEDNNAHSALDKIILQGYKALQLEYFFTSGTDEVKAWTIQKGTKAPQAAGKIHTDFEKGFIMAEVMKFSDFKEEGSESGVKAAGKYRQQGRNYVVEDGDIIFFKFNAGAGLKDAKKK